MNRAQRNGQPPNTEFTDTVIWEEATTELSADASADADTAQTVEISALLTDEETDSLLSRGQRKSVVK